MYGKKRHIIEAMLHQIIIETQQPNPDNGKIRELARDIQGMLNPAISPAMEKWLKDWKDTPVLTPKF